MAEILYIEDTSVVALVTKNLIERMPEGHTVQITPSLETGLDAVESIAQNPISIRLIIVDANLGSEQTDKRIISLVEEYKKAHSRKPLDGELLISYARQVLPPNQARILGYSGGENFSSHLLKFQPDESLFKPATASDLYATIRRLLP